MDDYLAYHRDYLPKRRAQLESLFSFLNFNSGSSVVSVGCGVAAEFSVLDFSRKVGMDLNPVLIMFCKEVHDAEFFCGNYMTHFSNIPDGSVDLVLALDIDTNILLVPFIRDSLRKLAKNGRIVVTERENNVNVYGRMLLLPFVQQIKSEFSLAHVKFYSRMNQVTDKDDRDNFVLVVTKV